MLCRPLLLLPSVLSIRILSSESKYLSFSFSISPSNEYSGLISFRMGWLDLLAVQGTLKSLLQHHSSSVLGRSKSLFWFSYKILWERLRAGGEGGDRGWDGWMASPTWAWTWVSSRSWWWAGKPGVLQSMGSQRVGHDWVTELNWFFSVLHANICSQGDASRLTNLALLQRPYLGTKIRNT